MDAQAVILAGGQGTRLRPLTETRPKPIVPLLNRPFLHYQLALLRQHGVTDIILSCSFRVEDVRAAMGSGQAADVRLRYVVEAEPLGTAGGVRNAADLVRGRIVVLNGDILTDADLGAVLRFHQARCARVTIGLIAVDDPSAYGLVETGPGGAVRRFVEKPGPDQVTTNTINAGIYVIEADLLRRIPTDRPVSIEREFFPAILADGVPCFGFALAGYWRDIGTPDAYREAQLDLLRGRVALAVAPEGVARDGCWVAPDVRLAPDAELLGPAVVGRGVDVAARARLGPLAVVGDGSRVGAGARVEGAVVWERVDIGAAATLRDCIVGDGAAVGARAVAGPGVVIAPGARVPEGARLER